MQTVTTIGLDMSFSKNARTVRRFNWRRISTWPAASTPLTWKTDFAIAAAEALRARAARFRSTIFLTARNCAFGVDRFAISRRARWLSSRPSFRTLALAAGEISAIAFDRRISSRVRPSALAVLLIPKSLGWRPPGGQVAPPRVASF